MTWRNCGKGRRNRDHNRLEPEWLCLTQYEIVAFLQRSHQKDVDDNGIGGYLQCWRNL
jgi:hypothetical protein